MKDLKEDARTAHAEIGANIRESGARLDAAVKDVKEDARTAHAELGANILRVDENVKAAEKRVTDNFNARFDDLRDYVKLALKAPGKD